MAIALKTVESKSSTAPSADARDWRMLNCHSSDRYSTGLRTKSPK
jgi:hypothetical protein